MIVDAQIRDVHFQVIGQLVGRAFHLELVHDDVHHAAEVTHAVGRSGGDDGHFRMHGFVRRDALQIDVNRAARNGIDLHFAHERNLELLARELELDDAGASAVMQEVLERTPVDGDRFARSVSIENARDFAGFAQGARFGGSATVAAFDAQ